MFIAFDLPWLSLTIENMRERVGLLHTITKQDIMNMKRMGQASVVLDATPVVYKSKLEEMLAKKREGNKSPSL